MEILSFLARLIPRRESDEVWRYGQGFVDNRHARLVDKFKSHVLKVEGESSIHMVDILKMQVEYAAILFMYMRVNPNCLPGSEIVCKAFGDPGNILGPLGRTPRGMAVHCALAWQDQLKIIDKHDRPPIDYQSKWSYQDSVNNLIDAYVNLGHSDGRGDKWESGFRALLAEFGNYHYDLTEVLKRQATILEPSHIKLYSALVKGERVDLQDIERAKSSCHERRDRDVRYADFDTWSDGWNGLDQNGRRSKKMIWEYSSVLAWMLRIYYAPRAADNWPVDYGKYLLDLREGVRQLTGKNITFPDLSEDLPWWTAQQMHDRIFRDGVPRALRGRSAQTVDAVVEIDSEHGGRSVGRSDKQKEDEHNNAF